MFCKECGAEIDGNAKYCKECGAKVHNDVIPKKEKSSFIKDHKKLVLCICGILIIFVIVALLSFGGNHTDVDADLSSGIENVLEDAGYSVSRSVDDGTVKLNAINIDLNNSSSNSDIIEVYIFDSEMSDAVSSEYS